MDDTRRHDDVAENEKRHADVQFTPRDHRPSSNGQRERDEERPGLTDRERQERWPIG